MLVESELGHCQRCSGDNALPSVVPFVLGDLPPRIPVVKIVTDSAELAVGGVLAVRRDVRRESSGQGAGTGLLLPPAVAGALLVWIEAASRGHEVSMRGRMPIPAQCRDQPSWAARFFARAKLASTRSSQRSFADDPSSSKLMGTRARSSSRSSGVYRAQWLGSSSRSSK